MIKLHYHNHYGLCCFYTLSLSYQAREAHTVFLFFFLKHFSDILGPETDYLYAVTLRLNIKLKI